MLRGNDNDRSLCVRICVQVFRMTMRDNNDKEETPSFHWGFLAFLLGAGEETRTLDLLHGKQSL